MPPAAVAITALQLTHPDSYGGAGRHLQVRPRGLEHRLVLLRVVLHVGRRRTRRQAAEEVGGDLSVVLGGR